MFSQNIDLLRILYDLRKEGSRNMKCDKLTQTGQYHVNLYNGQPYKGFFRWGLIFFFLETD